MEEENGGDAKILKKTIIDSQVNELEHYYHNY